MFHYISGKKEYIGGGIAVINTHGIGWQLIVSDKTAGRLSASRDETAKVFTYLNVREDAIELYGFYSPEELNIFKLLIGVSGIGPKAAIAILSVLDPEQFAMCVLSGDAKSISAAQGVGLKTAQKVILELKDKIAKDKSITQPAISGGADISGRNPSNITEAVNALVVLGYPAAVAAGAVSKVESADKKPLESIIREALKLLGER